MATDPAADLARFYQFISDRLNSGEPLSPEEALDLWRAGNPPTDDSDDTVAAVREALAEMEKGDCGVGLDEFDRAFRQRHGLPLSS